MEIRSQFFRVEKTLLAVLLGIGIILPFPLFAQSLSLEEAIQKGLDNRAEIKNARLETELAERQNALLKAHYLPQISGLADLRWNTQLQTTILPFDITGNNPEGTTTVKFGLPFNNTFGLDATQKILDPQTKYTRQINNTQVESRRLALEQQRTAVRQNITEAYYRTVFDRERLRLAEAALDRAKENLAIAQTRLAAGTLLENDFDRVRLDQSNAELALRKARQDYSLAIQALQYRMGVPQNNLIEPSQTLPEILADTAAVSPPDIAARTEIRAEVLNMTLEALNESRELATRRPTLSAYGNYSALQLSETFNPFKSGTWYPFNYIGLRLNVPIFDGRQARLAAGDYRIRQQISKNTVDQLERDITYEVQEALTTLYQARLDIANTQANLELAQQIAAPDQFRYEKNVLTQTELNATQTTLQNAETNYLTSVYNYLVALVRYRRAAGNL